MATWSCPCTSTPGLMCTCSIPELVRSSTGIASTFHPGIATGFLRGWQNTMGTSLSGSMSFPASLRLTQNSWHVASRRGHTARTTDAPLVSEPALWFGCDMLEPLVGSRPLPSMRPQPNSPMDFSSLRVSSIWSTQAATVFRPSLRRGACPRSKKCWALQLDWARRRCCLQGCKQARRMWLRRPRLPTAARARPTEL